MRLISGFSFGCFLIVILKWFSFCVRRAKELKVLKCLGNKFALLLIEKCVVQSLLVEANLFLAITLQPDLTIRAIIQALHQSTAASTWWCGPRPRLGLVEMAVGLPGGPSYPGHSPSFFRYAAP